jgi:Serine aminopeptidase, S33
LYPLTHLLTILKTILYTLLYALLLYRCNNSPSPRKFGAALCAQGIAVFMFDIVGHGRSEGERAFIKDYRHLVNDAVEVSATPFYVFRAYQCHAHMHAKAQVVAVLPLQNFRRHRVDSCCTRCSVYSAKVCVHMQVHIACTLACALTSVHVYSTRRELHVSRSAADARAAARRCMLLSCDSAMCNQCQH